MSSSTKHQDEALARLVLSRVLDTRVECVDKGPVQGHHDLEIYYPNERLGAGEVVSTRDPKWRKLLDAIFRRGYTECSDLGRLWLVTVRKTTRLNRMQAQVPSLLRQLEGRGIAKISRGSHGDMQVKLKEMGIASCFSSPPTAKHPPGFYLLTDGLGGWVGDGESVRRFCEDFLAGPGKSKVEKLRRAIADERHAVIILTMDEVGPHTAVDTGELPTNPPNLPSGVDWLWVIASDTMPIRTIYSNPSGQWSDVVLS